MNNTLMAIFLALGFCNTPQAWADESSRCFSIRDSDLRNACLASTRGSKSRCYSIKDADRKWLCLAQVIGERSRCYSVHDHDLRTFCLAGMGR